VALDEALRAALDRVPEDPGCYLYKDEAGKVIYVGKAINLRRRVFQYFQERADLTPKNRLLVAAIRSFETVVVGSEMEALVLEENLIKRYRPRYNILWRDDKRYPYLQLTLSEPYPRLLVTRRPHQSKDRYFGPFVHVAAMREALRLVHRHLGVRQCDIEIDRKLERPCLYYDLHQCGAPCVKWGETQPQYQEHARQAQLLLEGRQDGLLEDLAARMNAAAEGQRYEDAARWRDSLKAVELVRQRQRVVLAEPKDVDVMALAEAEAGGAAVKVFFIRGGKLTDWQDCRLANAEGATPGEVLGAFAKQFYAGASAVPQELLLSHAVEDAEALRQWLAAKRGTRVELAVPQRGGKADLLRLCEANAREMLREEDDAGRRFGERRGPQAPVAAARDVASALAQLQKVLHLPGPPKRIDGFDISHNQGSFTVASMVVAIDGRPARDQYRRYKVKTVAGVDDFASMQEVVGRRYARVQAEGGPWPDLIMIDGGKGQLGAAMKALAALGLQHLPVFGLAKRFEEFFVPHRVDSIRLGERDPGRLLIQRLRDEAHRFAITFHRQLRAKAITHSRLDDVAGVGPAMKKRLLKAFGSADGVAGATLEQLRQVEGVGPRLAQRLKEGLAATGAPAPGGGGA
jgi:excinuclease ABC subunit C